MFVCCRCCNLRLHWTPYEAVAILAVFHGFLCFLLNRPMSRMPSPIRLGNRQASVHNGALLCITDRRSLLNIQLNRMTPRKFKAAFIVALGLISANAQAGTYEDDSYCDGENSTFAIGACLTKELKQAERTLDKKLGILRSDIATWKIYDDSVKRQRETVLKAIADAHNLWKKLVDVECSQLAGSQKWGGSGSTNDEFKCRIELTKDRIQFISKNRAYSDYYGAR